MKPAGNVGYPTSCYARPRPQRVRAPESQLGGYFAFLTFAVIAVIDWRSAKAVGQRVPERDLVCVQGKGRPRRLARIFTRGKPSSDNGRRLLGEAWRRPGEEPEEPDSPLRQAVAGDQRLGGRPQ